MWTSSLAAVTFKLLLMSCLTLCSGTIQCTAGSGWNGTSCSTCQTGYYCAAGPGGSGPDIGWTNTLAGSGNALPTDGTGTRAEFNFPNGVAIDPSAGAFALIADRNNNLIRSIELASGVVKTLAGSGNPAWQDATGSFASFSGPRDIAIDPTSTYALIADWGTYRVRRVTISSGTVTTLAGSGNVVWADGTGKDASFGNTCGVAIDPTGTFALVTDWTYHRVRYIVISSSVVTTLAGSNNNIWTDGTGSFASFAGPCGVSIDPTSTYALVADTGSNRIRRIVIATGEVTTLAGSGTAAWADGVGPAASFSSLHGIAIDPTGIFAVVGDYGNNRIRRVVISTATVTTLAGFGAGWLDDTGSSALFNQPRGVSIDPSGSFVLIADESNHRIRRLFFTPKCSAGFYCPAGSSVANPYACTSGFYCPAGSSSASQAICTAGRYCPAGSAPINQSLCSAGFYCPAGSSSSTQVTCNGGYYCPAGSSSANQTVCSAGYYCPAGTSLQIPCNPGHYCVPGMSSTSQIACSPGYYCPAGSSSSTQAACSAGYYCPAGSSSASQTTCIAGYYCAFATAAPQACNAGYYCPAGSSSLAAQVACNAGYYCPAGSSSATQMPCPAGNFCPPVSILPTACAWGMYCPAMSVSQTNCSAGWYCPTPSFQSSCAAGNYCPAGSTLLTVCPAGSYCVAGVSTPVLCSLGKYCPAGSSASVFVCPAGSYCPSSDVMMPCPAGSYCVSGSTVSSGSGPCNGGYYCPAGSSSAMQITCPVSNFCPPNASNLGGLPQPCPIGFYCGSATMSSASLCAAGWYCASAMLAAPTAQCVAGYFCPAGSSTATYSVCSVGTYCPAGTSVSGLLCPAGTYCMSPSSSVQCVSGYFCPAGTTSNVGAGQCNAGFYCPAGSSSATQIICPIRNYCPELSASGSFLPCQAGSYCNASGLSSAFVCEAGWYCATTLLTAPTGPCLAGYYCPAGSIFRTAIICPAGSYCPTGSSAATTCPVGTFCSASGLTDVSAAQPCPIGQICPAGSVNPVSSCPAGYACTAAGTVVCSPGFYCPGGTSGAVPCPRGYTCPSQMMAQPSPCTGGYYCAAIGMTNVSGRCAIGEVCPVGSSAPSPCPAGYMCASSGISAASPCPLGRSCTSLASTLCTVGSFSFGNSTSCTACPSGLFSSIAGSSTCYMCAAGSFASNGTACLMCPTGSVCNMGAILPIESTQMQRVLVSVPSASNPFNAELTANSVYQLQQTVLVLGAGGALVLVLFLLAVLSQKSDIVGRLLNCGPGTAVTWVDLDWFFAKQHWTPSQSTLPALHWKTSFGGMMSVILILTVALVSIQLGISNLTPTYSSSVSIESPQWQPHGFYSLSVTMYGAGLNVCSNSSSGVKIVWMAADWSGTVPVVHFSYNSLDGSCLAVWRCDQCKLLSTTITALRIVISSNAFSTHAQYMLSTPSFTKNAADPGSADSSSLFSVSGYISCGDACAFQGGLSVVSTLLTVFNVSFGSDQRIAFQPAVSNILPGPSITRSSHDFSAMNGFEYRFELSRNSISIVNLGQTSNIFNLIVLWLSLAGSIISGFSLLLPQLEKRLSISTVWGPSMVSGDLVRNWSDKISALEVQVLLKSKQIEVLEETLSSGTAQHLNQSSSPSSAPESKSQLERRLDRQDKVIALLLSAMSQASPHVLLQSDHNANMSGRIVTFDSVDAHSVQLGSQSVGSAVTQHDSTSVEMSSITIADRPPFDASSKAYAQFDSESFGL